MAYPGNLYAVAAPSGAGKSTLVKALLELDSHLTLSISHTTRKPRGQDQQGREYHFVDKAAFENMIASGDFLEHANVYGNYYGTSRKWIERELEGDHDVLLEIDWQGAHQVKKLFPHAVGISILPPSIEELRKRLTARGKDSPETIERRMAVARDEIKHALDFEYIIVNESFDVAVTDLQSIVRAARLSRPQQEARLASLLAQFR